MVGHFPREKKLWLWTTVGRPLVGYYGRQWEAVEMWWPQGNHTLVGILVCFFVKSLQEQKNEFHFGVFFSCGPFEGEKDTVETSGKNASSWAKVKNNVKKTKKMVERTSNARNWKQNRKISSNKNTQSSFEVSFRSLNNTLSWLVQVQEHVPIQKLT